MIDPNKTIVPVLAIDERGNVRHFLGTGSFVHRDHLLLTADHVLGKWGGKFAIIVEWNVSELVIAKPIYRDAKHDLALLLVPGYKAPQPIRVIPDVIFHPNQFVIALDYGTTEIAGKKVNFAPATRLGNITRQLNLQERYGAAGENILELSFPALKGASGAPVISNNDSSILLGVIIANVSYHLLPAQIERIHDAGGEIDEEIRFMLPQGLAVNAHHVAAAIATVESFPNDPFKF